jgi:flavin reductase (DIM6/NTAB) family NADH-FMN oxidoreductase RutF
MMDVTRYPLICSVWSANGMDKQRSIMEGPRLDARHLRRAMSRFATGVAVVTTRSKSGKAEGVTVNSFSTVSLDPPLVLWSLARKARSFEVFDRATHFAVSILERRQLQLVRHFSSPRLDKLAGVATVDGHGGCPVIEGSLAHFECLRETTVEGGDHKVFLGRILKVSYRDGAPLIFSGGSFATSIALSEEAVA